MAQPESAGGATLFRRGTRCLALTPAGEAYSWFAHRALAEVLTAQERLRELRSDLVGQIRLTAPVSWGQRVLAKRLPEFLCLHPDIEIALHLADHMMDIAYERIDIAPRFSTLPAPGLGLSGSLCSESAQNRERFLGWATGCRAVTPSSRRRTARSG